MMDSILLHAILLAGLALIGSGIALAFRHQKTVPAVVMILAGVLCSTIDDPRFETAALDAFGYKINVTMKDVEDKVKNAAEDRQVDVIAPINLKLQAVSDSLTAQADLNKALIARLDRLDASATTSSVRAAPSPPVQPDILSRNPTFLANNTYSVLVFYRDARKEDATKIVTALTTAGFQASSINTSLDETEIGPQPNDSTYIIPTDRGAPIGDPVAKIIRTMLSSPRNGAVTLGSAHALRRGDVQVYLY